jgi:serine/threonine protein phosphatase PrpC
MRVDGDLAVSRCLGDFNYKLREDLPPEQQKVSPQPEIRVFKRDDVKDEVFILACDGAFHSRLR